MFSVGQICKDNFHPFGDVMDKVTRSLNVCHIKACEPIVSKLLRYDKVNGLYTFQDTNKFWSNFIYAAKTRNVIFQLYFSD